jgi:hypothetical protein
MADLVHDFLEPLFLPGAVAWIRRCHYLSDEKLFIRVGVRRATASNTDRVLAIGIFAMPFW